MNFEPIRFEDLPFDEESERRFNRGGFAANDPQRIRGIRDRRLAKAAWKLWLVQEQNRVSGRAAAVRAAARADEEADEEHALRALAQDAMSGHRGREARRLAMQCLLDQSGIKRFELVRLRALRDALANLRAKERDDHG